MGIITASFPSRKEALCSKGFTLIELLVTIAIIGILLTLSAPELGTLRERAEKVVCMGHLRSLHCALGAYVNDNEQWPQLPTDSTGAEVELSRAQENQFWLDALRDYGVTEKDWKCPTMTRLLGTDSSAADSDGFQLHYDAADFDGSPTTPRKWPGQPWVWEKADVHHGGTLMIRADGAVQTLQSAFPAASSN